MFARVSEEIVQPPTGPNHFLPYTLQAGSVSCKMYCKFVDAVFDAVCWVHSTQVSQMLRYPSRKQARSIPSQVDPSATSGYPSHPAMTQTEGQLMIHGWRWV
ncbi:hypothetical protein BDV19DRAFT_362879 [Aspergillus venezuelensis]